MRRFAIILGMALTLAVQADEKIQKDRTERNPIVRADPEIVELYSTLSELPLQQQRDQTWALSSKTKAALWTYNIERYLGDHPELSSAAQEILREGIRLANIPTWFDTAPEASGFDPKSQVIENFKRQLNTLPASIVIQVFLRLGPEPLSAESPKDDRRAGRMVPNEGRPECTCSGAWECGWFGGGCNGNAWCTPVPHCGVFNNEWCFGYCKD